MFCKDPIVETEKKLLSFLSRPSHWHLMHTSVVTVVPAPQGCPSHLQALTHTVSCVNSGLPPPHPQSGCISSAQPGCASSSMPGSRRVLSSVPHLLTLVPHVHCPLHKCPLLTSHGCLIKASSRISLFSPVACSLFPPRHLLVSR